MAAASETTDLDRLVEWLATELREWDIKDRGDVPGTIGNIRLLEKVLRYIAEELGGEDETDREGD